MTEKFDAHTTTIGELFDKGRFFRIPIYQRPFAWKEDNFEALIDDLVSADWQSDYFLGTVVLHEQEDENVNDVIDGQQRLTSLTLVLACLRDLIENEELSSNIQELIMQKGNALKKIPEQVRVEVRAREIFDKIIVENAGTDQKEPALGWSDPEFRYFSAIKIFKDRLGDLDQEAIVEFSRFLTSNCKIVSLSTKSFDEAFRLFEIVNDRGRQLRRIDIVKSSNLDPRFVEQAGLRETLAARWEELENDLGEDLFEQIFFHIRLMLVKDKPQADILKEFEDRVFKRKIKAKGREFLEYCFNTMEIYKKIFIENSALKNSDQRNKIVSLLSAMNSHFPASEWRACVLSFFQKYGTADFFEFLYIIERLYLYHWMSGIRKDERFSDYSSILNLIDANAKSKAVVDSLNDKAKLNNYSKAIVDACDRPDFYNTGFAKYVLIRLELVSSEFENIKEYSVKSVEHVLPQTPEIGTDWWDWFDEASKEKYVHNLGNLVLLSRGKNSGASNRSFSSKKDKYLDSRVSGFPRSVQVIGYEEWTPEVIALRTEQAKQMLLNRL